jgi:hypothetical protein
MQAAIGTLSTMQPAPAQSKGVRRQIVEFPQSASPVNVALLPDLEQTKGRTVWLFSWELVASAPSLA